MAEILYGLSTAHINLKMALTDCIGWEGGRGRKRKQERERERERGRRS